MVNIPALFADTLAAREGDAGRAWLAELPDLIDHFLQQWACGPTGEAMQGRVGIVLPVRRSDGTPAILKISLPHPGNQHEAHAFACWQGRGAVRLYERDDDQLAMLLERAQADTLDVLPVDAATQVCGELSLRLAVPAPPELPRLSDRARQWGDGLRTDADELGRPLSTRALDAALTTVAELGREQPETMVHGDLHFGNVVRSRREPWLVIDPKGWVGDRAFDGWTVLVRAADSLLSATDVGAELRRRLAIFADAAELDTVHVFRWAQLQAAMGAHHARRFGAPAWEVQAYELATELLAS